MVKKYFKDWKNFVDSSSEFLASNFYKSRVTLKYRNKLPSYGKLYLTNDNKSYYIKLTKKKDVDKLETYLKGILHMMANKPIEKEEKEEKVEKVEKEEKKEKKENIENVEMKTELEEQKENEETKNEPDKNKKSKKGKKNKNKKGKK